MDWKPWMDAFVPALLEAFPGRVAFVGIQGSYGRGEAGPLCKEILRECMAGGFVGILCGF